MPKWFRGRSSAALPTIRSLSAVWLAAFVALTLIGLGALLGSSAALHRAVDVVARDVRSAALISELEAAVLMHQRLANLVVITGEAGIASARTALLPEIRRKLREAQELVGGPYEQEVLERVSSKLEAYLEARDRAELGGARLEEVLRTARGSLGDLLADLRVLRELNDGQVARARAQALRADGWASAIGISTAVLLIAGFVAIAVGVRRYVLRPVTSLHDAMRRFRDGERDARARDGGVQELSELARMFDEMADNLARQRQAQLTFLAGVAHDLKSPLATLKTGMFTLEYEASEVRRGKTRALLDRQVDLLTRMVDDLLDATRIEAGHLELRRSVFDLRPLVKDVAALYAPTAPNHRLQTRLPPDSVVVEADGLRIEQVVRNLVSNAIKYSPEGGDVAVGVEQRGQEAVLYVTDTGIGIPADEQQSIFLPFRRRRLDVATGAGLGLSVVRRIVAAHGGRIEVQSQPGTGSTFTVVLPALSDQRAA